MSEKRVDIGGETVEYLEAGVFRSVVDDDSVCMQTVL